MKIRIRTESSSAGAFNAFTEGRDEEANCLFFYFIALFSVVIQYASAAYPTCWMLFSMSFRYVNFLVFLLLLLLHSVFVGLQCFSGFFFSFLFFVSKSTKPNWAESACRQSLAKASKFSRIFHVSQHCAALTHFLVSLKTNEVSERLKLRFLHLFRTICLRFFRFCCDCFNWFQLFWRILNTAKWKRYKNLDFRLVDVCYRDI